MNEWDRAGISGIVLAGGRSRRFGADKLTTDVGGRPLLHHAITALAAVSRVSAPGRATGPPREYALRLLVEPCRLEQPEPLQACVNN